MLLSSGYLALVLVGTIITIAVVEQQGQHEREIKDLRAKVGELVLGLDVRKKWQALSQDPEMNS